MPTRQLHLRTPRAALFLSSTLTPLMGPRALAKNLKQALLAFEQLLAREFPFSSRLYLVGLMLCGSQKMKSLNQRFRGRPSPTDVLSFPSHPKLYKMKALPEYLTHQIYLGDIVICQDLLLRQAQRADISPREELLRLFAHGLWHLVGLDHERSKKEAHKMKALEEETLKETLWSMTSQNSRPRPKSPAKSSKS